MSNDPKDLELHRLYDQVAALHSEICEGSTELAVLKNDNNKMYHDIIVLRTTVRDLCDHCTLLTAAVQRAHGVLATTGSERPNEDE